VKEALVEKTQKVIDTVSRMECIKPYVLVGGTALSLQLKHRLSEDLDFMRWQETKKDKQYIDIPKIKQELNLFYTIDSIDIFEFNHVEFHIAGGVKLSYYAPEKKKPAMNPVSFLNNLVLADDDCIASLKMETLLRRSEFRDYYDLYCILKNKDLATKVADAVICLPMYAGLNINDINRILAIIVK
jgi:predicted nucleotidyltransferase component of viral defense system